MSVENGHVSEIFQDISFHEDFAGVCGLTAADVRQALTIILPDDSARASKELNKMKEHFCGYRFSAQSDVTVFNTTTALFYLNVLIPFFVISFPELFVPAIEAWTRGFARDRHVSQ
jgi:hypothetical protein